jgi:hypothetical protein
MLVINYSEHFKTAEFPKFIGHRINKAGCPLFGISEGGKDVFLNNSLLKKTMIKLPIYIRLYIWLFKR